MLKQTVLVTGGAGFIGRYSVKELLDNNFNVVVVDRKEKPQHLDCQYFQMDVTSHELAEIFKKNKIDYIIHLAALPSVADSIKMPLIDCRDNYQATVNVCTIAKLYNVKKNNIFINSCCLRKSSVLTRRRKTPCFFFVTLCDNKKCF